MSSIEEIRSQRPINTPGALPKNMKWSVVIYEYTVQPTLSAAQGVVCGGENRRVAEIMAAIAKAWYSPVHDDERIRRWVQGSRLASALLGCTRRVG